MKTASVRDLRYDFPKVEAWLVLADRADEQVRRRGAAFAASDQPLALIVEHRDHVLIIRRGALRPPGPLASDA